MEQDLQNGKPAKASLDKRVAPILTPDSQAAMKWLAEQAREYVGQWVVLDGERLIRRADDLKVAITECEALIAENVNQRTKNFATLAKLMAEAALWREESRGGHFRADFPTPNDEQWDKHSAQTAGQKIFSIAKTSEANYI